MPDTRFQPGNTLNSRRKHHGGGRPPGIMTSIKQEMEENPNRTRDLLDKIYSLAMTCESPKVQLAACIDYLDRIGMRAPRESNLIISGTVAIGTPEDYRRAAMLLSADRQQEQLLLNSATSVQPVEVNEPADSTG